MQNPGSETFCVLVNKVIVRANNIIRYVHVYMDMYAYRFLHVYGMYMDMYKYTVHGHADCIVLMYSTGLYDVVKSDWLLECLVS